MQLANLNRREVLTSLGATVSISKDYNLLSSNQDNKSGGKEDSSIIRSTQDCVTLPAQTGLGLAMQVLRADRMM